MSTARRGVKYGLNTVILGALVAGTGTVVVAQVRDDAAAQLAQEVATVEVAAAEAHVPDGATSADVPLVTDLATQQLQHVAPASRSQARTALDDGVTFTVVVDGATVEVTSGAATLADALAGAGIVVGWDDQVSADLASAPEAGAQVLIGRAGTQYVTEQVLTPHATEERKTSELLEGETRVVQEGVDGDDRVTSEITLVDGVEVSRTTVVSVRSTEPVTEIVEVGTRKPTRTATPAPSSSSSGSSDSTAAPAPAAPSTPVDPGTSRAIAQEQVAARGWGEEQWTCLDSLWQKESNWNHQAQNRSSGAYGIPQSLPGSKMASVGADWRTNPATQITWGLNYIEGRYGNPCGAWDHSKRKNWY